MQQDKRKEIEFFGRHAEADSYDVFTPRSTDAIIERFAALARLGPRAKVADLGCGSGVFSQRLAAEGYECLGLDLSESLLRRGRQRFPALPFVAGDVEALPFADNSLDGVLLSGIVHHLPDPDKCAREAFRVLRPGGAFVAFDPNRLNPFMYLYRDHSSPFYSSKGVTANERPVMPGRVARTFTDAGFRVQTSYLVNLHYQYVASGAARWLLPAYNALTNVLFRPRFMAPFGAFVVTSGIKGAA